MLQTIWVKVVRKEQMDPKELARRVEQALQPLADLVLTMPTRAEKEQDLGFAKE
jgi:hypothetical protein